MRLPLAECRERALTATHLTSPVKYNPRRSLSQTHSPQFPSYVGAVAHQGAFQSDAQCNHLSDMRLTGHGCIWNKPCVVHSVKICPLYSKGKWHGDPENAVPFLVMQLYVRTSWLGICFRTFPSARTTTTGGCRCCHLVLAGFPR
eukprot:952198-Rhodomonas_salina.8